MAVPTHRIDLLVVPAVPDEHPIKRFDAAQSVLTARLVTAARGAPGDCAGLWIRGGFSRWRLDDPGRVTLYANRQGGFRVRCPVQGASVVPAFSKAVTAWRAGGAREMRCSGCGSRHPLEALDFAPPAAFARLALVFSNAEDGALTDQGARWCAELLGPHRVVVRRG